MDSPIDRFAELYERAGREEPFDHTALSLATVGADGRPSVRMVLLKGFDERGFQVFTNLGSRKASDLMANPRAAICFYWPSIKEQVRVEGAVEELSDEESDRYFATRPRGSQIGAWASRQSDTLASRGELEKAFAEAEARFKDQDIPRPPYWGGFRVVPFRIEFWTDHINRLHDRDLYEKTDDGWTVRKLYP